MCHNGGSVNCRDINWVDEVWAASTLVEARPREIRKIVAHHAMERGDARVPLLVQREPIPALDAKPNSSGRAVEDGALVAIAEDQGIGLVLLAADLDSIIGHLIDSEAISSHNLYIWLVEGLKILIVEASSLTPTRVPRLKLLGRVNISHDFINPSADAVLSREIKGMELLHVSLDILGRLANQVWVPPWALWEGILVHPSLTRLTLGLLAAFVTKAWKFCLLSNCQLGPRPHLFSPLWICRLIIPSIHSRGSPLKNVELFGPSRQGRYNLDCCSAGTNNSNVLVFQLDHIRLLGCPSGAAVVSTRCVEASALELFDPGDLRDARDHNDARCENQEL